MWFFFLNFRVYRGCRFAELVGEQRLADFHLMFGFVCGSVDLCNYVGVMEMSAISGSCFTVLRWRCILPMFRVCIACSIFL